MKKVHFLLILLVLWGNATFSATLADAVKYIDNEQYTRAKNALFSLMKASPTASEPLYYLGKVYLQLENTDSAFFYFNKSVSADTKFALGQVGLGATHYLKGDKMAAKSQFDQAIAISKNKNAEVLARIAEVYLEAKDMKELTNVLTLLDRAIYLNNTMPEYFILRGDAYVLKQDGSRAVEDYHEASRLNPKLAKAYIKEGKLYLRTRNFEEALRFYDKGIEVNPDYSPAYREKGELYAKMRKYPLALESYEKYMKLSDNDDDTKFRYASFLFMTQDYKDSKALINQLFAKGYSNKIGYRLLGYSDYELGDSLSSVSNLELFFKQTDSSKYIPSDFLYYGRALVKTGKAADGIKNLSKAFAMDSTSNYELLLEMAEISNTKLKDYSLTIYYYEKASKKFKPRFNDLYNLGRAYYFEKRYADADTTFGTIIANYPKYPYGYTWKANTKSALDPDSKNGLAKPYFEKVVELFGSETTKYKSDLMKSHSYLGAYYQLVAKDNAKAGENWKKLLLIDPENKQAKDALLLLNQGKK